MAAVVEYKPHAGNSRKKHPEFPAHLPAPGFRFVRRFLLLILLTAGLLVSAAGLLGWYAEMDVTVKGQGAVEPADRYQVKAELGGTIQAIHVERWQQVSPGDRIATLDRSEWEAELRKLDAELEINRSRRAEIAAQMQQERDIRQAEVKRAAAEIETVTLQAERVRREYELYDAARRAAGERPETSIDDLLPVRLQEAVRHRAQADLDRARRRLRAVENRRQEIRTLEEQREKLEQERRFLMDRLARTDIRAPRAGTVLTGDLDRRVGDRIQPGEALLELGTMDGWQAKLMVQEADIPRIEVGQPVRLYVDAFPYMEYKVFKAVVAKIPAVPAEVSAQPPGVFYPVTVTVFDPDVSDGERTYSLACGMRVDARIVVDRGRVVDLLWRKLLHTAGKFDRHDFRLAKGSE